MTIDVEPISEEEMVGYVSAMLSDGPLGEPSSSLDESPALSG